MKARLQAVQRLFWSLLALSVGLLIANATGGNNGPTMEALVELEQFASQFDQAGLEASLLEHARAQGRLPLAQVAASASQAPGVPELTASPKVIEPAARISLATLGELSARMEASETTLGLPNAADLSGGLAFLLARRGAQGSLVLEGITLQGGNTREADLTTFRETEAARLALAEIRKNHARADKAFEKLDELFTQRRKWKAHWRVLNRTQEKRDEALAERDALKAQLVAASDRYQSLATAALEIQTRLRVGANKAKQGPIEGQAIAVAALALTNDGNPLSLFVPVAMVERRVPLPPLVGVAFPATHAADLWRAVQDKTPRAAVQEAEQHFGWHHRHIKVGPLKLGGMTVLHLWPLVFPLWLWLLRRRARGVSAGYDPYAASDFDLPRVGTGLAVGDTLVVVVLPTIAIGWAMFALAQIDQWPVIALPCALACLIQGPLTTRELNEVRGLKDAVRASHSHPPAPLKETSTDP